LIVVVSNWKSPSPESPSPESPSPDPRIMFSSVSVSNVVSRGDDCVIATVVVVVGDLGVNLFSVIEGDSVVVVAD
jgi:hypothetical protein